MTFFFFAGILCPWQGRGNQFFFFNVGKFRPDLKEWKLFTWKPVELFYSFFYLFSWYTGWTFLNLKSWDKREDSCPCSFMLELPTRGQRLQKGLFTEVNCKTRTKCFKYSEVNHFVFHYFSVIFVSLNQILGGYFVSSDSNCRLACDTHTHTHVCFFSSLLF